MPSCGKGEDMLMTWKDFNEYNVVKMKDGLFGVVVVIIPGFNSFEFEYIDDEGDWFQETCNLDDAVEVFRSYKSAAS